MYIITLVLLIVTGISFVICLALAVFMRKRIKEAEEITNRYDNRLSKKSRVITTLERKVKNLSGENRIYKKYNHILDLFAEKLAKGDKFVNLKDVETMLAKRAKGLVIEPSSLTYISKDQLDYKTLLEFLYPPAKETLAGIQKTYDEEGDVDDDDDFVVG